MQKEKHQQLQHQQKINKQTKNKEAREVLDILINYQKLIDVITGRKGN